MEVKSILIIVPSFKSGGTVSSLINFVSLIDKAKFNTKVFAITNSGPNKKYVAEHCVIVGENNNQHGRTVASVKSFLRAELMTIAKAVKKMLDKIGIDISPVLFKRYAKLLDTGEYDYILAFQEGQATLFGSYFNTGTKVAWVRSEYTRFNKIVGGKYDKCYSKYDKIVSVSKAALSSFLSVLPQYSNNAYVQYNFLNDERIISMSKEIMEDLRDDSVFTIVTLGRIDPVKRVSEIPRLCKELRDLGFKFKWIIIGGVAVKEEYALLKDNVDKYQVQESVVALGNRPNPYPYLKNCDLLVSLSLSETFNNTLTEAKILGVPVVTTNYPCAFESIENNKEGLVVSFDNLVQAIGDMISNKNHIYSMIKDNLLTYHYDKEKLLAQLYLNILN